MANFRLFYDKDNGTATIVLTNVSPDVVQNIGAEILKVAIEPATGLKGVGFSDETPTIPTQSVETKTEEPVPFTTKETHSDVQATQPVASAVIEVNPVYEDSNIQTSLLDAPIGVAEEPTISNEVEKPNEPEVSTVEEIPENDYVFNFGAHKDVGISELIADDPAKAFSYARWLLHNGVLRTKNPGEDVFKRIIFKLARDYYSRFPMKEKEVKDVVYVVLSSISETESNEILALLGFSSIAELYTSENVQCYSDAIKMAFA